MSKNELVERTRQALAAFERLPPEEQFRKLIARGVIDSNGEVLFGREEDGQTREEAARSSAAAARG